jgi:RNA polymerase sigma factor (sigma-70 family)
VKKPEMPPAANHGRHADAHTAAFQQAILPHLDAAYTLARYLTRRNDVAEDIVQEAALRAYRGIEGQRGENARAWLLAIVRNCFLTWQAREGSRPLPGNEGLPASSHTEGRLADETEQETPESLLIRHDESRVLRSLIEQLPHSFREVLVLRDVEEMSYRDIASITGVPIGTVMSRLARARKMFAAAWNGLEMAEKERRR